MKRLAIVCFVVLTVFVAPSPASADQAMPLTPGDTGAKVTAVQYVLRSHGYVLPVDGSYGARTVKAVMKWQRANGLTVDGVVGPQTWESLVAPAQATAQAVRVDPPALVAAGLNGMPFAPAGLSECDEMSFYRAQAGLPERFDALGWRESNCKNTAANSCCYGYWQNYISSHLSARSLYRRPIAAWCQVDSADDILGIDPLDKQRQACVTAVVYSISGYGPWAL